MPVVLNDQSAEEWVPVALGEGAEISVLLRRPTYAEVVAVRCAETVQESGMLRLKAIRDWVGVNDENNQAVRFSEAAMARLLVEFPASFGAFLKTVQPLFDGPTAALAKN